MITFRPPSVCSFNSGRLGALRIHIDCVQRLTGSHEKAVFLGPAEAEVGASLRKMNLADEFAVGSEDVHAVVAFATITSTAESG